MILIPINRGVTSHMSGFSGDYGRSVQLMLEPAAFLHLAVLNRMYSRFVGVVRVSIAMVRLPTGIRDFIFIVSRPALGATQPPI
jgi:hypothetical protein